MAAPEYDLQKIHRDSYMPMVNAALDDLEASGSNMPVIGEELDSVYLRFDEQNSLCEKADKVRQVLLRNRADAYKNVGSYATDVLDEAASHINEAWPQVAQDLYEEAHRLTVSPGDASTGFVEKSYLSRTLYLMGVEMTEITQIREKAESKVEKEVDNDQTA